MVSLLFTMWAYVGIAQEDEAGEVQPSLRNIILEENQTLPRSAESEAAHEQIKQILASDKFAQKKTIKRWQWIDTEDEEARKEKIPEAIISIIEFFEKYGGVFSGFATGIEIFIWSLALLIIIFVVYRYHETIRVFVGNLGNQQQVADLPTTLLGLDIKKESLPDDIASSSLNLWNQQQHRLAIALLLRASLVKLVHEYGVLLYDSHTEQECCAAVELQTPTLVSDYFHDLVAAWQSIAYAHVTPSDRTFLDLSTRWPNVFDAKFKPTSTDSTRDSAQDSTKDSAKDEGTSGAPDAK